MNSQCEEIKENVSQVKRKRKILVTYPIDIYSLSSESK